MNNTIGLLIKKIRCEKGFTQKALAEKLHVSDKTISKWERSDGYPDIEMLKPLCELLDISMVELFEGVRNVNLNTGGNMLKTKFYVCPVCGNIIVSSGDAVVACHGIRLEALKPLEEKEKIHIEKIQDQYYVTYDSPMTKKNYVTFIAAVKNDGVEIKKLYPEMNAEAYFRIDGIFYFYICDSSGELICISKRDF